MPCSNRKRAGLVILVSDKIAFKSNTVTRDKESPLITIKGSIQQEDITILNTYAPNIKGPKYIKQTLTNHKGETESITILVRGLTSPLSIMGRLSRQNINKKTADMNNTIDQIAPRDIYRTFYPIATEYSFLSRAHRMFSRMDLR